ncbi:MAG: TetR/AcrR family transcriptional regulator [Pseudomonadota bacterium]
MYAFWRHGYETTSVAELTQAMGVTAPSLYAAFGDKKGLFLEAVRLYAGDPASIGQALDATPTARDAVQSMLEAAARGFTGASTPRGCLLASATASGSAASADVQAEVREVRLTITNLLAGRIERDVSAGVLAPDSDPMTLARFVIGVIQGMSVLARDGLTRDDLLALTGPALQALRPATASP